MLWYEECEADDERDDDDRPSERVSWEPCEERDEKIVNRAIHQCRQEWSQCPWCTLHKTRHTISWWSFDSEDIFPWTVCYEFCERSERKGICFSRLDIYRSTKRRKCCVNILDHERIHRNADHLTWEKCPPSTMIGDLDMWKVWDRESIIFDTHGDISFCIYLVCIFWCEKVLKNKRERQGVECYEDKFLVHGSDELWIRDVYSPCMIEESAIWCPTTRWLEHARRSSLEVTDGMTISSRGMSDPAPLLVLVTHGGIWRSRRASNESSTLSILISLDSGARAVSLRRWSIFSCGSVIFLYNGERIIKKNA